MPDFTIVLNLATGVATGIVANYTTLGIPAARAYFARIFRFGTKEEKAEALLAFDEGVEKLNEYEQVELVCGDPEDDVALARGREKVIAEWAALIAEHVDVPGEQGGERLAHLTETDSYLRAQITQEKGQIFNAETITFDGTTFNNF
ncbi:hypothetical protein [Streptomyces sp. NPDC102437]|uniref:hypothetical protein n=1 Tax=Streptomyces sp. NPDC102437 TaxID=3366175 RepID=UPI00382EE883